MEKFTVQAIDVEQALPSGKFHTFKKNWEIRGFKNLNARVINQLRKWTVCDMYAVDCTRLIFVTFNIIDCCFYKQE